MICSLARLFRLRLATLNGVAALGGCFLFPGPLRPVQMLAAFFGVTLLAMGGSALNQVLEKDVDALMERTRFRPLPQGEMTRFSAVLAGASTVLAGCALLASAAGLIPALLGALALAWYLSVYTPLKRRSSTALLLGALCGSVPPLIGWCLAGGTPSDYRIIILSGLFFIWQIPHFWLLQQRHRDDYRRAGISLFPEHAGKFFVSTLMFIWLLALLSVSLMLLVLNMIDHRCALWFAMLALLLTLTVLFRGTRQWHVCYHAVPLMLTLVFMLQRVLL